MNHKLYDMKLHERYDMSRVLSVVRVPGGWLYQWLMENGTGGYDMAQTFVPFDTEFQTYEGQP